MYISGIVSLAFLSTLVLANEFDVCCETQDPVSKDNAYKLIDDMLSGKLEGKHFWWQNGDAIIETNGAQEKANSFPDKLRAIRDKCTPNDEGLIAAHTCDHDPTQADIQLYRGPQKGWKDGSCINLHWNSNKCLYHK